MVITYITSFIIDLNNVYQKVKDHLTHIMKEKQIHIKNVIVIVLLVQKDQMNKHQIVILVLMDII